MSNRPEWASGPEWEGWTLDKAYPDAVFRSLRNPCNDPHDCISIEMRRNPVIRFGRGSWWDNKLEVHGGDMIGALTIANAYAEAAGGWK